MSETELHQAVAAYRWLQSMRLSRNLVTSGVVPEAHLLAEESALLDPLNLTGANVLEVGAANGFFSFAVRRRGAARVVATDHLAWTLPGADAQSATQWAAHALGLEVETMAIDPRSLSADFGSFHVVLATAFFEQVFNPIQALRGLRSVTNRVLLLETLQDELADPRPMMTAQSRIMPFGGADGCWIAGWAPNPPLMVQLLRDLGFDRVLYRNHPTLGAARGIYAALLPEAPDELMAGFEAPWINLTSPPVA